MKAITSYLLAFFFSLSVLACSDKEAGISPRGFNEICFSASTCAGWENNAPADPYGRTVSGGMPSREYAGHTALGDESGDVLFLHTSMEDGIQSDNISDRIMTRGTPVDKMYQYFSVTAFSYSGSWNEGLTPNLMYNARVSEKDPEAGWFPDDRNYYWPKGDKNVRFFAFAPFNCNGVTLSSENDKGLPTLDYTVPKSVAAQNDLIVAVPEPISGSEAHGKAALVFKHILTAVKFRLGTRDKTIAGQIKSVSIRNAYGQGTYTMDSYPDATTGQQAWKALSTPTTFSIATSRELTVDPDNPDFAVPGQEITTQSQTMMMLPQILPDDAVLEVVIVDQNGKERTLYAALGGTKWPVGKTVIYEISTSSIKTEYVFGIYDDRGTTSVNGQTWTAPYFNTETFDNSSESKYVVASYKKIYDDKNGESTKPIEWTATYYEWDDEAGDYNPTGSAVPPSWVSALTYTGGNTASTYSICTQAQPATVTDPWSDKLRAATPVNNYDLSMKYGTRNTSNCYIVNGPGTYCFPAAYGNAIKNGAANEKAYTGHEDTEQGLYKFVDGIGHTITQPLITNSYSASLTWQDVPNLISNVKMQRMDIEGFGNVQFVTFEITAENIAQGNAIISSANGTSGTFWSWHIWVTPYDPRLQDDPNYLHDVPISFTHETPAHSHSYTMAPYNVGWCNRVETSYGKSERGVKIVFRQSGDNAPELTYYVKQNKRTSIQYGNNPLFQWGRKDPIPASLYRSDDTETRQKPYYNAKGDPYRLDSRAGSYPLRSTIAYPGYFYTGADPSSDQANWCNERYNNLWSTFRTNTDMAYDIGEKTIYDPCPVGYMLPPGGAFDFIVEQGNGIWVEEPILGVRFSTLDLYLPLTGYRSGDDYHNVGTEAYYWTCVAGDLPPTAPQTLGLGYSLHLDKNTKSIAMQRMRRANAFSVRPIRESN